MKFVFITGVSSGMGYSLAKAFLNAGYNVIGSLRTASKGEHLKTKLGELFHPVIFDVCNTIEIDIASEKVKNILGDHYLCGLINNAGAAEIGPLLHVPIEEFINSLNLLVVGQLYIIQKFFPLLTPNNTKLPKGRIINLSSVSGVGGNFGYGTYSAGKHALEGISKTLRQEVSSLYGVKVIVFRPANIKTSLWSKQIQNTIEKYKDTAYFYLLKQKVETVNTTAAQKLMMDSDELSKIFIEIFEKANPAKTYTFKKSKFSFRKSKISVLRSYSLIDKFLLITGQK